VSGLVQHPGGACAYLPAGATFSDGLVVNDGYLIADWELAEPLPLRAAFERVGVEIERRGLGWEALAGVELRSPEPFTPKGFADFNADYVKLLAKFYPLAEGDLPPYTRTNVAPVEVYLSEPCVRMVQMIEPQKGAGGDFVVSGAAEITTAATPENTIAYRDTSPDGLRAKVDFVVGALAARVAGLGVPIEAASTIDVYTAHRLDWLESVIGETFVGAGRYGMHRWIARPPVTELEFEMGCKRISKRVTLN